MLKFFSIFFFFVFYQHSLAVYATENKSISGWGYERVGWDEKNRGFFEKIEFIPSKGEEGIVVTVAKNYSCESVVVTEPGCSFNYIEMSYNEQSKSNEKKILNSKWNGMKCASESEKQVELHAFNKTKAYSFRLFDSKEVFLDWMLTAKTSSVENINGEVVPYLGSVSHTGCISLGE